MPTSRHILVWLVALIASGVAAECAARLDDYVRSGVPILANPDPMASLRERDGDLTRGRPGGHYKKWQLDAMGFRVITAAKHASEHCGVVLVMGASETFGQFESPDKDYPSQLQQQLLTDRQCARVENSAVVGMSLAAMRIYWSRLLRPLHPDVVVLYPSPHFYVDPEQFLEGQARERRVGQGIATSNPGAPRSRFIDRLRDYIHKPDFIQRRLNQKEIDQALMAHPTRPLQAQPSVRGLAMFGSDLTALINDIQAAGAAVILVAPGRRAMNPPRTEDWPDLLDVRRFSAFVPETVFLQFSDQANDVIRTVAAANGVVVVAADRSLTGCRKCFGDLVHLTDSGAARVAGMLKGPVESALARRNRHAV